MKVILPGEMGIVYGDEIGTFAVGSGCRGYLVYDQSNNLGGVAHVDFADQDVVAVNDLIVELYRMGARELAVGATRNADIDAILAVLGIQCMSTCLPSPEFAFDSTNRAIKACLSLDDKQYAYESRKDVLKSRIRRGDHELLWV